VHAIDALFYAAFPRGKNLFHGREHIADSNVVGAPVADGVITLAARALRG